MAAILVSLGFTFLIDRMTEVLTPDIYIELTGVWILDYLWLDKLHFALNAPTLLFYSV